MSKLIPVNPDVLRWARETAGFDIEDVALRMKKSTDVILSWESGESSPSYVQLEKLAYQIYKRPTALFFFPKPPEEESPEQSFRTLPEYEISKITPQLRFLIRKARVMQINLAELNDNINPATRQIVRDLIFSSDNSAVKIAVKVREYMGADLSSQFHWKSTDEAFKTWRSLLEKHGVSVFKEAFKNDAFSGFCLYDNRFPVIFINNSKPATRQIFTLFHELAHLLLGTGGIDKQPDDYINILKGDDRKIEILCNQFAGEFLVPDYDFDKRIAGISVSDTFLQQLSERYHVSQEVILRKFLNRGAVDQAYYESKVKQWAGNLPRKSGSGGDYYRTKGVYLGEPYIEKAFGRYYQNKISVEQLAGYLDVKVRNISGMESLLFNKGSAI